MSAVLFIVGLLAFAAGGAVLLGGGSLCASASATSFAKALAAPCGGVSRVAGIVILVAAAALLWSSTRLQRQMPNR